MGSYSCQGGDGLISSLACIVILTVHHSLLCPSSSASRLVSSLFQNDDGKLVYKEFIPIAIDLVQAQRASAYAQTMTTNVSDAAYKSALNRIQHSKDLHRCMDSGLGHLDPHDTGSVTIGDLVELLRGMDVDLTDGEIACVLHRVRQINKSSGSGSKTSSGSSTPQHSPSSGTNIVYKQLQDDYETILVESIQQHTLDKDASSVETYLNGLFRKKDPENTSG